MTLTIVEGRAYAAAALGAAVLDAKLPGWAGTLELHWFHISTSDQCIIGQLAQNDMARLYEAAGKALGSEDYAWGLDQLSGIPSLEHEPYDSTERYAEVRANIAARGDWAARHGFDLAYGRGYGAVSWGTLQEAWVWAIAQRRGADPDVLWEDVPYDWKQGPAPRWPLPREARTWLP